VSVEGLLRLEGAAPGAIGGKAGKLAWSAGVGAAVGGRVQVSMGESRAEGKD